MTERLKWVDIYKGLAIILVVVGHSTGLFNPYIYQFHMAAFFFISGYTSRLTQKGLIQTTAEKSYGILLPYTLVFLVFLAAVALLDRFGFYSVVFADKYTGLEFALSEFSKGRIYINLLGASWFLLALFGIYLVQRLVLFFCGDRPTAVYLLVSAAIFAAGYGIVRSSIYVPDSFFYLVFIGQFYFALGLAASQAGVAERLPRRTRFFLFILSLNVFLFYWFAWVWPNTVDYPSRHFGNALTNILAALNGITFLYVVSVLVERLQGRWISAPIIRLGQNTLGILFFHFLFFKVGYLILAAFGLVGWSYVSTFIPTPEIGQAYWWLLVPVSLALSALVWSGLLKIPGLRLITGQDKSVVRDRLFALHGPLARFDVWLIGQRDRTLEALGSRLRTFFAGHNPVAWGVLLLVLLAVYPWLQQGVTCNDEVQTRFWAMLGWDQFSSHYLGVWTSQGRTLGSALNIVSMWLGFLSTNLFAFRAVQVLVLLGIFGLGSSLVARLFRNSPLGVALFTLLVLLLPISFEHTAPNAFAALLGVPELLALASFQGFLSYLERRRTWLLVTVCISWFVFLTAYEAFLLLTPMFVILVHVHGNKRLRDGLSTLITAAPPVLTSVGFVLVYGLTAVFFPSSYSGNSLAVFNFDSSLAIVQQLFASGLPGYYLSNPKYQYLFTIYSDSMNVSGAPLSVSPVAQALAGLLPVKTDFLQNLIAAFGDVRILLMSLIVCVILGTLVASARTASTRLLSIRNLPGLLVVPLVVGVALAVPNSLGKLYQGNVNANSFSALPVTFLIFCFTVTALVFLLWFVSERTPRSVLAVTGLALFVGLILPIQAMNGAFAQEQYRNFNRMVMLEDSFDTATVKQLAPGILEASDYYLTKNNLAFIDGYWTALAQAKGLNLQVVGTTSGQGTVARVPTDDRILLAAPDRVILLSLNRLDGQRITLFGDAGGPSVQMPAGTRDGRFFTYVLDRSALASAPGGGVAVALNDDPSIGDTLKTAKVISGISSDGWVSSKAELTIRTGEKGKLVVSGFISIPLTKTMSLEVLAGGKSLGTYPVTENKFQIEVPVNEGKKVATLTILPNWSFEPPKPDIRTLSFLLLDIHGE